jgi:hypothetical protein
MRSPSPHTRCLDVISHRCVGCGLDRAMRSAQRQRPIMTIMTRLTRVNLKIKFYNCKVKALSNEFQEWRVTKCTLRKILRAVGN